VEKLKIISRRAAPAALVLIFCACLLNISCRTNESPEGQVTDLEITANVKAKLASDIGPSSVTNISVNSTNSVVTLSGQVDSVAVKSRAVAIAKDVPKVARVVDSLQVTPKPQ
jgi:osmotically-inducible protein OsmY